MLALEVISISYCTRMYAYICCMHTVQVNDNATEGVACGCLFRHKWKGKMVITVALGRAPKPPVCDFPLYTRSHLDLKVCKESLAAFCTW